MTDTRPGSSEGDPAARVGENGPLPAGALVADGRYRLLAYHGGPAQLQFWQALDTALDRPVALTFIDPDGRLPAAEVADIMSRTLRLSQLSGPGIARILDVCDTGSGGLVVAEWIRGGSLREVAATTPSPIGGARAIQSLAAAAAAAHAAGVPMSIDHPARLRVSIEGDVALAFPATLREATPEDDIRGIGAALYALLVDRWPLPETGDPSGLAPAELDADGQPLEPRALNRGIPFQISAAALRAVQDNAGIRTAPTMLNLLQQATAVADRTALIESVPAEPEQPRPPGTEDAAGAEHARRKRAVLIGVAAGAAVLLVALLVLASILNKMFGDVGGGLNSDQLGLNAPSLSQSAKPTVAVGGAVKPVRVSVFSPDGGADNPADAGKAIDGNPNSAWSTDVYTDNVPFPNFKSGVGLLLELPEPTTVGSVTLTVPSTGTSVQIRAASSPDPAALADTTELTRPTTLQPGKNVIPVDAGAPTSNLLVWITTMGTTAGKNKTELSEIVVNAVK